MSDHEHPPTPPPEGDSIQEAKDATDRMLAELEKVQANDRAEARRREEAKEPTVFEIPAGANPQLPGMEAVPYEDEPETAENVPKTSSEPKVKPVLVQPERLFAVEDKPVASNKPKARTIRPLRGRLAAQADVTGGMPDHVFKERNDKAPESETHPPAA